MLADNQELYPEPTRMLFSEKIQTGQRLPAEQGKYGITHPERNSTGKTIEWRIMQNVAPSCLPDQLRQRIDILPDWRIKHQKVERG